MSARPQLGVLCTAGLLSALFTVSVAHAQSVVVLRLEPAAEPICAAVESALMGVELRPDPGYYAETQRRGLDPASEQALATLTPMIDADVVATPLQADYNVLWLDLHAGRTGQPLGQIQVPLVNGALQRQGAAVLNREVRQRLSMLAGARGTGPPPATRYGRSAPGPGPIDGSAADRDDEADEDEDEEATEDTLQVELAGGFGLGARSLTWPTQTGLAAVTTGAYPAAVLCARPFIGFSESVYLGALLEYATSIGAEVEEKHVGGTADQVKIRSHRFAGGVGPQFRFGDRGGYRLDILLGYATTNLRPWVHHLLTPHYSLAGPFARLIVRLGFSEDFAVVLAPGAQLLMHVGDDLQAEGAEGSGFAFQVGGFFELALNETLSMQLVYSEQHAAVASTLGGDVSDVERLGALRLSGVF